MAIHKRIQGREVPRKRRKKNHRELINKFSKPIPVTKIPYELHLTKEVESKIKSALVHMTPLEVSWFGEVEKINDLTFRVSDIKFPPQLCKSTFVETDDDKYPGWFFETYVKTKKQSTVRLHGHTHPTFGAYPSGTDTLQFEKLMEEVDDYFIQFIINNRLQVYCVIHIKETGKHHEMKVIFETHNEVSKDLDEFAKPAPIHIPGKIYYPKHTETLFDHYIPSMGIRKIPLGISRNTIENKYTVEDFNRDMDYLDKEFY